MQYVAANQPVPRGSTPVNHAQLAAVYRELVPLVSQGAVADSGASDAAWSAEATVAAAASSAAPPVAAVAAEFVSC